jgi:LuxR family glucitol operon transcriptional activator
MPAVVSAVRNTCFAILSAIETDVRALIDFALSGEEEKQFLPSDVRDNALVRYEGDTKHNLSANPLSDSDLLDYSDFADLAKMLHINAERFAPHSVEDIRLIARELDKLSQARNRVCHSRPLEDDDLPRFLDLCGMLLNEWPEFPWESLRDVEGKRRTDPSFIFRIEIPSFWRIGSGEANHNLPLPDFDETGFLGRNTDRKELMKHLQGPHPVVTVVGEGGDRQDSPSLELRLFSSRFAASSTV